MRPVMLAAVPLLLLAGCATGNAGGDAHPRAAMAPAPRYQTTATVLQSRDHGPELCLGAVLTSFPPQCRGLPITNWHWDQVEGQQTGGGTTWGTYRLIGTYDGASFTVLRADLAPPLRPPSAEERFRDQPRSPCPEPEGGWPVPDPARRSEPYLEPVSRAARAEPDFAGVCCRIWSPWATTWPRSRASSC